MDCHDEMYLNQPVFRISHTNRVLPVDLTLSVLSKIDRWKKILYPLLTRAVDQTI